MTVHYRVLNSAMLSLYMELCMCFMRIISENRSPCYVFACGGVIDFTKLKISCLIITGSRVQSTY